MSAAKDVKIMDEPTAIHSTFVIERSYPKPPARVFAAFADPAQKRRWFAESETRDLNLYEMDFQVSGAEVTRGVLNNKTPVAGMDMLTVSTYHDIVPDKRIVQTQVMAMNGKTISIALITFELLRTDAGTDVICTHQGTFFEGADGPQMREHGWNVLLDQLGAQLA